MLKILRYLIKFSTLLSNVRYSASFRRLEESTHIVTLLLRPWISGIKLQNIWTKLIYEKITVQGKSSLQRKFLRSKSEINPF